MFFQNMNRVVLRRSVTMLDKMHGCKLGGKDSGAKDIHNKGDTCKTHTNT